MLWELDRAHQVKARLAVAEERLRVARDLHDVLGRSLALIAVNSELAAELARRGRADAAERMLEVRELAQNAMRDVRDVGGGARDADLDSELAGARSVRTHHRLRLDSRPLTVTAPVWSVCRSG